MGFGKVSFQAKGNVCTWIYLFEILEETEQGYIWKKVKQLISLFYKSPIDKNRVVVVSHKY